MAVVVLIVLVAFLTTYAWYKAHKRFKANYPVEFEYFKTQKAEYYSYCISSVFWVSAILFATSICVFSFHQFDEIIAFKWGWLLLTSSVMFSSASYLIFERYYQVRRKLLTTLSTEAATAVNWVLKSTYIVLSLTIAFFAELLTSGQIQHITGYSTQNFSGLIYLQLLISALLILGVSPLLATLITLHGIVSESTGKPLTTASVFKTKILKNRGISFTAAGAALYLSALFLIIFSSQFIDSMFKSMFVMANFHSPSFECMTPDNKTEKPLEVAHLTRNLLDNNNLLLAEKINGHWTFRGIHCTPMKIEKQNEKATKKP